MNIVGKRNWYFAFSLLIIIPGVISLFLWGLNLSIDFTGGSEMVLSYPIQVNQQKVDSIRNIFTSENIEVVSIAPSGKSVTVRTKPMDVNRMRKYLRICKKIPVRLSKINLR